MMMPYSFHDDAGLSDTVGEAEMNSTEAPRSPKRTTQELHMILSKIEMPPTPGLVDRSRISDFLERSAGSFGATLISGRAGTGKTYAGRSLADKYSSVAWYTIDSTDSDWSVFSNYLWAAIAGGGYKPQFAENTTDEGIETFLSKLFAAAAKRSKKKDQLIVLDDLHHVFDARWFNSFFTHLLPLVPGNAHLLMLCRSRPAMPLWRLRSKQVLNVIDERMLAFDTDETAKLCRKLGIPEKVSRLVPQNAFGRAGKVADFLRSGGWGFTDPEAIESQTPLFIGNTDPFVP
jgi:LuxR family transcriptional regulator, maltose regulon positive regulatory protein